MNQSLIDELKTISQLAEAKENETIIDTITSSLRGSANIGVKQVTHNVYFVSSLVLIKSHFEDFNIEIKEFGGTHSVSVSYE